MTDMARDRLPKDLRQAALIMAETGTFQTGQGLLTDAADEIERLRKAAMDFRESVRKAALDTEQGHEILDFCYSAYFQEHTDTKEAQSDA